MIEFDCLDFHECEVISILSVKGDVFIELDEVVFDKEKWARVELVIHNVSKVLRDDGTGILIQDWSPAMEADGGEVLALEINKGAVFLLIVWFNYKTLSFTVSYDFFGASVSVNIVSVYGQEC